MSSFGQVKLSEVWDMLNQCAAGWKKKEYTHFWCVMYNGKTYTSLPKRSETQIGHVKKLARHLGILDCAKKRLNLS
jgi:hypothetical protein